ncbi:bifunctional nuclease 2 isoform X1 [Prosopis cineraria]|uniref:bifunctional nuclease 2 isoform X1 n=2 Tax=Prosopis cineraria TaxID=364024 RepID=UPI0024104739|nr:bifunctional nuclease 2 isoform X1 [Prosopis cineraria]XP_054823714.1 bifunctional nuclease 2 isoform X1 [Prosopis cineraria]XP_054823715.1 bifunctional nuclease 2 isoform X1 [Prosopis cineraria]XP_054823716.1 bifunctional nuclease 2 isoform X1 [Prosopis cineraria]
MLALRLCVRTVPGVGSLTDQINTGRSFPHALAMESTSLHSPVFKLGFRRMKRSRCRSTLISCNSSRGTSGSRSNFGEHHDNEFLEASLLLSETISHYQMLGHGFQEDLRWNSTIRSVPISRQAKNLMTDADIIIQTFFQRFQTPTIFLKISCDGDYVLPIVVGKFAIEKLLDVEVEHENGDCPDQYQFVKNLVERLDHEVIMVRITKRVVSTYFARLYISKPGRDDIVSVDARPSDAINVANRCKAPIYVSKQIVLTDAIRLGYGMGRVRSTKSTYDVLLDSPADGPDLLSQELSMMQNMNIAAKLERFKDAASWRDKLADLRKSEHEH